MDSDAAMNITVVALDEPTSGMAALFTKNAFPGSPIHVGRDLLSQVAEGKKTISGRKPLRKHSIQWMPFQLI